MTAVNKAAYLLAFTQATIVSVGMTVLGTYSLTVAFLHNSNGMAMLAVAFYIPAALAFVHARVVSREFHRVRKLETMQGEEEDAVTEAALLERRRLTLEASRLGYLNERGGGQHEQQRQRQEGNQD